MRITSLIALAVLVCSFAPTASIADSNLYPVEGSLPASFLEHIEGMKRLLGEFTDITPQYDSDEMEYNPSKKKLNQEELAYIRAREGLAGLDDTSVETFYRNKLSHKVNEQREMLHDDYAKLILSQYLTPSKTTASENEIWALSEVLRAVQPLDPHHFEPKMQRLSGAKIGAVLEANRVFENSLATHRRITKEAHGQMVQGLLASGFTDRVQSGELPFSVPQLAATITGAKDRRVCSTSCCGRYLTSAEQACAGCPKNILLYLTNKRAMDLKPQLIQVKKDARSKLPPLPSTLSLYR